MDLSVLYWVRIACQVVALFLIVALIPISGKRLAWGLIAAGIGLQICRGYIGANANSPLERVDVFLPLVTTLLVTTGFALLFPIFRKIARTEADLRDAEQRFRQLAEASLEAVIVHEYGMIVDFNLACVSMFGFPADELRGMSVIRLVAPDSTSIVQDRLKSGDDKPYGHNAIRVDGTRFPVEVHSRSLQYGKRTVRVTTIRDITARRRTEQALRDSQRALSTLLGNLPGMAYRCLNDRDWTMEFVSSGCRELTGYGQADLTVNGTATYASLIHPNDRDRVWREVQEALQVKTAFRLTYRLRTADGKEKWVWEQGTGVFRDDGGLEAIEGFVTDITAQKKAEEVLRDAHAELEVRVASRTVELSNANDRLLREIAERAEVEHALRISEERFRSLSASAPIGIFLTDPEGRSTYVNRRLEEISGLTEAQALGYGWYSTLHPDDRTHVIEAAQRSTRERSTFARQFRIQRSDGSVRWVFAQNAPMLASDGMFLGKVGTVEDVTERKLAEQALRESEERYAMIVRSVPVALYSTRSTGVCETLWISEQVEALSGFAPSDFTKDSSFWADRLHPDDKDRSIRQMAELTPGSNAALEYRWRCKDGRYRWFLDQPSIVQRSADEDPFIVGTWLDITQRKWAEEALRESEQRFEGILENTRAVVFLKDLSGRYLLINRRYEEIFGFRREDVIGKTDYELFSKAIAERFVANDRKVLESCAAVECEEEAPHLDGPHTYLSLKFALLDSEGRPTGVCGISTDITDRKRDEEALRRLQKEQQAILDSAPVMIWYKDSENRILRLNVAAAQSVGLSVSEVEGRSTYDLYPNEAERYHRDDLEVIRTGVPKLGIVERFQTATNEQCWIRTDKAPYRDEDGRIAGVIVVAQDITDRILAEQELKNAKEAAESASRAKSVFLANMSHEVRTPIMAMLAAAELSEGSQRDHREIILRNGRHLLALVNDLLDVARLETGKLQVRPVFCSLVEILTDVRAVTTPLTRGRPVELRFLADSAIPETIHSDPTRLKQAIINLVDNALKFTEKGSVQVRIRVDATRADACLIVSVQDTGPGIAPGDRERIFQTFTQLQPSQAGVWAGVGLGLPLARRIAEDLGGGVDVQSGLGDGATFTLRVNPGALNGTRWLAPDAAFPEFGNAPGLLATRETLRGTVLLAEDAKDTRELVEEALTAAGAEVTAVTNGREAVEACDGCCFDLILMDIRMPEMDGICAARTLRSRGCKSVMIALTASTGTAERERILSAGFDDFWPKPIPLIQLVEDAAQYLATVSTSSSPVTPLPRFTRTTLDRLTILAAEFAKSLPARLEPLRAAIQQRDTEGARAMLHQLVGTAGIHGYMQVSNAAGRLHRLLGTNDIDQCHAEFADLERAVVDRTRVSPDGQADGMGETTGEGGG